MDSKLPPLTPAEKMQILMELMGGTETHECDRCDHTHIVERPSLISKEDALKILNGDQE